MALAPAINGLSSAKGTPKEGRRERLKRLVKDGRDPVRSSQDYDEHEHDPECEPQIYNGLEARLISIILPDQQFRSAVSVQAQQAQQAKLRRSASQASLSSSSSEPDDSTAYRNSSRFNTLALPGVPNVSTGALNYSVSGGAVRARYDSYAPVERPRRELVRDNYAAYPSVAPRLDASTSSLAPPRPRNVWTNPNTRRSVSQPLSASVATSSTMKPTSTTSGGSSQHSAYTSRTYGTAGTSAVTASYNPYNYIPTTARVRTSVYRPPSSVAPASTMTGRSTPLTWNEGDEELVDPSFVESEYIPSLDNPERHRNKAHTTLMEKVGISKPEDTQPRSSSDFTKSWKGLTLDVRFAVYRGKKKLQRNFAS